MNREIFVCVACEHQCEYHGEEKPNKCLVGGVTSNWRRKDEAFIRGFTTISEQRKG